MVDYSVVISSSVVFHLQEAFQYRKQQTISRLRERQKRLNLAAEQRTMEAYLKMERDKLFQEERRKEANPEAHPYSGRHRHFYSIVFYQST